jgi:hypothetical protein
MMSLSNLEDLHCCSVDGRQGKCLEEVLGAFRAGKKIRQIEWREDYYLQYFTELNDGILVPGMIENSEEYRSAFSAVVIGDSIQDDPGELFGLDLALGVWEIAND